MAQFNVLTQVNFFIQGFHDRGRAARCRMQEIQRMTPQERHECQIEKYRELIEVT